jgi:polysaccharide export outer membrane protein
MVEPGQIRDALRAWGACLAFLAGACCLGCQSGVYSASSLPTRFDAPPLAAAREMNLTRLVQARPNDEQIFTGDVLEIAISTGLERINANRWMLRVAEDGAVVVPLVGPVQVAGLLLPQAESAVGEMSVARGIYRSPLVTIRVAERRSVRVSVAGEVLRPGDYSLPVAQADLLAAISAAGGVKNATAGEIIEISHPAPSYPVQQAAYAGALPPPGDRNIRVNLQDLTAATGGDFHLENGSVVMVTKRAPRSFSVMGLVRKPGNFDKLNDEDLRLLDAIAMAGGRTLEIADKVRIYRQIEGQETPIVIDASIGDAKAGGPDNLRLAPGDIVSVEETPLTLAFSAFRSFARLTVGATARLPGL